MRFTIFFILQLFVSILVGQTQTNLPRVFSDHSFDKLGADLRQQAKTASWALSLHSATSFSNEYKKQLKANIIEHAAYVDNSSVDLKLQVTGSVDMGSYIIENISYQSQKGIFVTANIYRPKAEGVYPAVISTHGHWANGRRTEIVQTTAQLLALNGFVCLAVDAWGAGERATSPLVHEYHGSNLGASLMNVGSTLLGLQLMDNIRGVDLLASLPYVDAKNIGATGASGGGNQAMWLAAMDERIKAVIPVVSVGTFESYVMNSNCVCELLPHGLTFAEEDAVLALIVPRALSVFTAMNDANPSFVYSQMKRSYMSTQKIYAHKKQTEKINYTLFNTGHGYGDEMQMKMLSLFTKLLKDKESDSFVDTEKVQLQEINKLATYPTGKVAPAVLNTEQYCKIQGKNLKKKLHSPKAINMQEKKEELRNLLSVDNTSSAKHVQKFSSIDSWERIVIETESGHLIPVLYKEPKQGNKYTVVALSTGKESISLEELVALKESENGCVLVDLWGIGECQSLEATKIDGSLPNFHTLSRSSLWLGQAMMGRWVEELNIIVDLVTKNLNGSIITLKANKEVAVAALFRNLLANDEIQLQLDQLPSSYLFDSGQGIDFYNMSIHIPHILEWGDISLALALVDQPVSITDLRTMSGRSLNTGEIEELANEISSLKQKMNIEKSKIEINQKRLTLK